MMCFIYHNNVGFGKYYTYNFLKKIRKIVKLTPGKSMPINRHALSETESKSVCDGSCMTAHYIFTKVSPL